MSELNSEELSFPFQAQSAERSDAIGSQMIPKVLSPAVRLWLRSQVEAITKLEFQISGSDRQILRGHIPKVTVAGEQVVYQGLHLSQVDLAARQIQINLGQVLRGKPLRLLKSVPVQGTVRLTQADLDRSCMASLFQQALTDVWRMVLATVDWQQVPTLLPLRTQLLELHHPQVRLNVDQLTLSAALPAAIDPSGFLTLHSSIQLISPSCLQFIPTELICHMAGQAVALPVQPLQIDLGNEVNLQQLTIDPQQVYCVGQINIVPGE